MHPAAEIADRALADPTAIDIEDELGASLHSNGAGIDGAQDDDEPILAVLDEVVDDPALQFERHDLEQEHHDGQHHQERLVPAARRQHIAEYVIRDAGYRLSGAPATAAADIGGHHPTNPGLVGRRSGESCPACLPNRSASAEGERSDGWLLVHDQMRLRRTGLRHEGAPGGPARLEGQGGGRETVPLSRAARAGFNRTTAPAGSGLRNCGSGTRS